METFGAIITLIGSLFLLLAALGLIRMPDVYNRMQAGTKATTFGTIFFMTGLTIAHHDCLQVEKIIILVLFIVLTNPVSSHALSRAAHFSGISLAKISVRDSLKTDEQSNEGDS